MGRNGGKGIGHGGLWIERVIVQNGNFVVRVIVLEKVRVSSKRIRGRLVLRRGKGY